MRAHELAGAPCEEVEALERALGLLRGA